MPESQLYLLHFNDVYHIKQRKKEPVGGAARFLTALSEYHARHPQNTLRLCSGDCFSPSIESSITKGRHWPPIYQAMALDVACLGNHDFDFGIDMARQLVGECGGTWLLTNVIDARHKPLSSPLDPAAGVVGARYHIKHVSTTDGTQLKIGFIGLVEYEWLATISNLPEWFEYHPFLEQARLWIKHLKSDLGCDFVIALTHMRVPNDEILMREVPEVDLILGGHDHFYCVKPDERTKLPKLIKSGSDFMDMSYITIKLDSANKNMMGVDVEHVQITSRFAPDPTLQVMIDGLKAEFDKKLSQVVCMTDVPLDALDEHARTRETNVGNFITDIMRINYSADVAILCGGTIRADNVFEVGQVTLGNWMDIFPFEDPVVVVKMTGRQIWQVLENGVSMVPKHEGRFPQVSGLHFSFDPRLPPGKRVVDVQVCKNPLNGLSPFRNLSSSSTRSANEVPMITESDYIPLDMDKRYSVATRSYMFQGNDGFDVFKSPDIQVLVNEEEGCMPSVLIRRCCSGLKALGALMEGYEDSQQHRKSRYRGILNRAVRHIHDPRRIADSGTTLPVTGPTGNRNIPHLPVICPQVTGRIRILGEQQT